MTDEIFNLMQCFPDSVITPWGDVMLNRRGSISFNCKGIETKEGIIYKLLEWCSRPMAKGEPYSSERNNILWRRSLILSLNNYLNTNFTESDIWIIYDKLGNAINHDRTIKFVSSGFDMNVLKHLEGEVTYD